ncbi:MAG: hypothetical protein AAGF11_24790 [Myxococcota bacterium]
MSDLALSTMPEAIGRLHVRLFGEGDPSTAFVRSVLATINAFVAYDFDLPDGVLRELTRPSAVDGTVGETVGDTLGDALGDWSRDELMQLVAATRRGLFPDGVTLHDPYVWIFPVHIHLLRSAPEAPFIPTCELRRYGLDEAWTANPDDFGERHERPFVTRVLRDSIDRLGRDFGEAGARAAIDTLREHFLPYNSFYHRCIERVGCPGFEFRLRTISEVFGRGPIRARLADLELDPHALNIAISAPPNVSAFAFLPQLVPPGTRWNLEIQRRTLGLAHQGFYALGFAGERRAHAGFSPTHVLTHEIGHLFQLHHLGVEVLERAYPGRDDFDYPSIGVASDTIWRPPRRRTATLDPERSSFVGNLHSRSMYMNFMSVTPEIDDALFFTRAQAARARLFAMLHYRHLIERGRPWPAASRWVGRRDMSAAGLAHARFDAPPCPVDLGERDRGRIQEADR